MRWRKEEGKMWEKKRELTRESAFSVCSLGVWIDGECQEEDGGWK